jgi:hypothetical protein
MQARAAVQRVEGLGRAMKGVVRFYGDRSKKFLAFTAKKCEFTPQMCSSRRKNAVGPTDAKAIPLLQNWNLHRERCLP